MGFVEAGVSGFKRYFDFSTRSSRSEFWYFILFIMVAAFILGFIDGVMGNVGAAGYGPLGGIFSLAIIIPSISVSVRRLHDIDKSGWFYLIYIIPLVGFIMMIVWGCTKGTEGPNRFGDDPLNPTGDMGEVFD